MAQRWLGQSQYHLLEGGMQYHLLEGSRQYHLLEGSMQYHLFGGGRQYHCGSAAGTVREGWQQQQTAHQVWSAAGSA
jgi:hypothetical protein